MGLLEHPVLGAVEVVRSSRARRIVLRMRPDGSLRLAYPWHGSRREALNFLERRTEWVNSQRARLRQRLPEPILEPYRTRLHTLHFLAGPQLRAELVGEEVRVYLPEEAAPADEAVQQAVRRGITEAFRAEAKALLPEWVERTARRMGITYGRITVRASRTRWGSCSARGDLSLSLYLMRLPDELIELVLVHELSHRVHPNHSPAFHALVDRTLGGRERALNRALRSYRSGW